MADNSTQGPFRLRQVFYGFIGLALLVAGGGWSLGEWVFDKDAKTAIGTVLKIEAEGSGGTSLRPTFLFKDSNGRRHLARTNLASSAYDYTVGDEVPIQYNFQVDEDVRIEGWVNSWKSGAGVAVVGLFFLSRARRRRLPPVIGAGAAVAASPWGAGGNADGAKKALIASILQPAAGSPVQKASLARPVAAKTTPAPRRSLPTSTKNFPRTVQRMR